MSNTQTQISYDEQRASLTNSLNSIAQRAESIRTDGLIIAGDAKEIMEEVSQACHDKDKLKAMDKAIARLATELKLLREARRTIKEVGF